tara:strand:- start:226 stop:1419 length:1194 start_codon:yes stop_codon:yes gene_type:complete
MSTPNGGLITETNEEYYVGQKVYTLGAASTQSEFVTTFNTELTDGVVSEYDRNYYLQTSNDNGTTWVTVPSEVKTNTSTTIVSGTNSVPVTLGPSILVRVAIFVTALESNYGGYSYIKLGDIINNFLIAYVGAGKLIPSVKRTDVIFHAKRGLQEFSYDTLKSVSSMELTIPASLSIALPQDYVNYVRLSWIDSIGVKHIIYPANELTINPIQSPEQDSTGEIVQNSFGTNNQLDSQTDQRWNENNTNQITGIFNQDQANQGYDWWGYGQGGGGYFGQRYGLNPSLTQGNGWFTVNERTGSFSFSSDLANKLVVVEYVSDGLAYHEDSRVPKMAEDAMYSHLVYSILSTRINQPEYVIRRWKQDRYAKLRNAKIRLSNLKIEELTQIMRGKSKMIKN